MPASSRVGELRPSAATISEAGSRSPLEIVAETPNSPRSRFRTSERACQSISGSSLAASNSARRSWRLANITPSEPSCGSGRKSMRPGFMPSVTAIEAIGQPCGASRSARPMLVNRFQLAVEIAEARPSKPSAVSSAGSARSTTWLEIPLRAAARASVMPTRPPPRIRRSRLSDMGHCPRAFATMRASSIPLLKALIALLALALALPSSAQLAAPATTRHLAAELIADGPPVPGETLTLAIKFTPDPGWHGYWANPGDAGYGMQLDWDLPEGWTAGEPLYPVPQKLLIAGLMNHVYEGEYAVLVPIEVPESAAVANPVPIEVKGDWLVCTNEVCVPESATLTLRLGQGMGGDPRFDRWQAAVPPLLDSPARFELTPDKLRVAIPLPASL